jgi:hypothetical protein
MEWKARPTTYNGVEMRSRLEAKFAALLRRHERVVGVRTSRVRQERVGDILPRVEIGT